MNIIDSLFVELGFDTTKLKKGQVEAEDLSKKASDNMSKRGKDIEEHSRATSETLLRLRNELVGLYAAFTAGKGLKEFITDITNSDAAVGRLATVLGIGVQTVNAWGNALKSVGGSQAEADQALRNFVNAEQEGMATGESPLMSALYSFTQQLGATIPLLDPATGKFRSFLDVIKDLSALAPSFPGGAAQFSYFMSSQLGLPETLITQMLKGPAAIQALIDKQNELNKLAPADTAAAQARQTAWANFETSLIPIGRTIVTQLSPALVALGNLLTSVAEWAQKHPAEIEAAFWGITAAVGAVVAALTALAVVAAGAFLFTNPIGWALLAIMALVASSVELYEHWNAIKAWWHDLWENMSRAPGSLLSTINSVVKFIVALFTSSGADIDAAWNNMIRNLGTAFGGLAFDILSIPGKILAGFVWLATRLAALFATLGRKIYQALVASVDTAITYLEGRVTALWDAILGKEQSHIPPSPPGPMRTERNRSPGKPAGGPVKRSLATPVPAHATPPARGSARAGAYPGAQQDIATFQRMGWSREQATGIVAQIARESSGNPNLTGDSGLAYGLAQWHPDRQAAFATFAGRDIKSSTRDQQLAFINNELRNGSFKKVGDALSKLTNAGTAADLLSRKYERPRDVEGEARIRSGIALGLMQTPLSFANLGQQAAASNITNHSISNTDDHSVQSEVTIGNMSINAPNAKDAAGIAKNIKSEFQRALFNTAGNYGPA